MDLHTNISTQQDAGNTLSGDMYDMIVYVVQVAEVAQKN